MGQGSSKGGDKRDRSDFVAHLVVSERKRRAGGGQTRAKASGKQLDELCEEAKQQLRHGDLRSAEKSLAHVAKHDPANLEAKVLLAKLLLSQGGRNFPKAEDLYMDVLKRDPHHPEGLAGYGTFLGKHVKDYESAEQVLLLAAHENRGSRSLHVLHLHAQELAKLDSEHGEQEEKEISPPPIPIGAGPTAYGSMCEPPNDDAVVGWSERKFPDYGMNIRAGYISEGGQRYSDVLSAEAAGQVIVPTGGMVPKVTVRGKADKLFCNFQDEPSDLEAPTGVRRGNRVWPAHWYQSRTVATRAAIDPEKHLSLPDVLKLEGIFNQMTAAKAKEDKQRQAATQAAASHLKHTRTQYATMSFANLLDAEKASAVIR